MMPALSDVVVRTVRAAYPERGIGVDWVSEPVVVEQFDLRADAAVSVAHIVVRTRTDRDAQRLNGARNLYSGPLQKAIQRRLTARLGHHLGVGRVRLQFLGGTERLEDVDFGPRVYKPIDRISIVSAISRGLIPREGVVARTCSALGIPYVLIRSGLVVGPNPALLVALEEVVGELRDGEVVFDPFAGTGVTAHVAAAKEATVVATDAVAWHDGAEPTGVDSFVDMPPQLVDRACGVLVVDPLYEDVLAYLTEVAARLTFRYLVVVAGDACDVGWNDAVRSVLRRRWRVSDSCRSDVVIYGKRVFVAEPRNPPAA